MRANLLAERMGDGATDGRFPNGCTWPERRCHQNVNVGTIVLARPRTRHAPALQSRGQRAPDASARRTTVVSIAPHPVQQDVSSRLLLVSNRAPIEHRPDVQGRVRARPADGGVATALESVSHYAPVTWIASAATAEDQELAAEGHAIDLGVENKLRFVSSAREAYELHYNTFCNPMLWFLHHGLWSHLRRDHLDEEVRDAWERGYVPVNQGVCHGRCGRAEARPLRCRHAA